MSSKFDGNQILRLLYDPTTNSLRTQATLHPVGTEIAINQLDDSIQSTPFRGALTDRSGSTSGSAGTSTQACAANTGRKYLLIQNLDATNPLYVNFTAAASTSDGKSFKLQAGGSLVMETSFVSTEAVNVCSSAASVAYAAKEGN